MRGGGGGVANAKPKYPPDASGGYNKPPDFPCFYRSYLTFPPPPSTICLLLSAMFLSLVSTSCWLQLKLKISVRI